MARKMSWLFFGPAPEGAKFQPVAIQAEWRKELLLWLVDNDPRAGASAPLALAKSFAETDYMTDTLQALSQKAYAELSFLAPVRARVGSVEFASSCAIEACLEFRRLDRDSWQSAALEDSVRLLRIFETYASYLCLLGLTVTLERIDSEPDWLLDNGNPG